MPYLGTEYKNCWSTCSRLQTESRTNKAETTTTTIEKDIVTTIVPVEVEDIIIIIIIIMIIIEIIEEKKQTNSKMNEATQTKMKAGPITATVEIVQKVIYDASTAEVP